MVSSQEEMLSSEDDGVSSRGEMLSSEDERGSSQEDPVVSAERRRPRSPRPQLCDVNSGSISTN